MGERESLKVSLVTELSRKQSPEVLAHVTELCAEGWRTPEVGKRVERLELRLECWQRLGHRGWLGRAEE